MFSLPIWFYFVLAYAALILFSAVSNKRDFKECPEKGERYAALPLAYKLVCWFIVLPSLAAVVFHQAFGLLSLISYFLLESACKRWYRNAGLY